MVKIKTANCAFCTISRFTFKTSRYENPFLLNRESTRLERTHKSTTNLVEYDILYNEHNSLKDNDLYTFLEVFHRLQANSKPQLKVQSLIHAFELFLNPF